MKNVLFLYASKHGATLAVARKIATRLEPAAKVVYIDLQKQASAVKSENFSDYDAIILGTSVYIGQPRKAMANLIKHHGTAIQAACSAGKKSKLYLYVCAAAVSDPMVAQKLEATFTPQLMQCAGQYYDVGHVMNFNQLGFFERMIMKKVKGTTESEYKLKEDAIEQLSSSVLAHLESA